jgi:hypothetical protein
MEKPIKILQLDSDYNPMYFLIRKNSFIKSTIPQKMAKDLIMKDEPDLIICVPLNKAFFNHQVDPTGIQKGGRGISPKAEKSYRYF